MVASAETEFADGIRAVLLARTRLQRNEHVGASVLRWGVADEPDTGRWGERELHDAACDSEQAPRSEERSWQTPVPFAVRRPCSRTSRGRRS